MTLKEAQYLIKHIELGTLEEKEDTRTAIEKKDNIQRLVLKLIEEFGELAENIRKNARYTGESIKGTIEEEAFDIFYYIIAIANEYDIDLENSFAYGDTTGDLTMFKAVENAIAINPAKKLFKKIKNNEKLKEKVKIIVERKDIIYQLDANVKILEENK